MQNSYKLNEFYEKDYWQVENTPDLVIKDLPFYLGCCAYAILNNSDYFQEFEICDDYYLLITLSGSGTFNFKGKNYTIRGNEAFITRFNSYQYNKAIPDNTWEFYWIDFSGPAAPYYYNLINENQFSIISLNNTSEICKYIEKIRNLVLSKNPLIEIEISRLITNILTEIINNKFHMPDDASVPNSIRIIDQAVSYINKHYIENICMDKLASTLYISRNYLYKIFKKYFNQGPYEYITRLRIRHSKKLLTETCFTVNEIAAEAGFADVNNYIRSFKKLAGMSPSVFRNLNQTSIK